MTDFRALCAELLMALENAISIIYCEDGTKHISTAKPIVNRARAALAEPEPEGPPVWTEGICGDGAALLRDGVMIPIEEVVRELNRGAQARAVLARWGNLLPVPPADGEVAELISKLQKLCADLDYDDRGDDAGCCYRAAELLQRQVPVPVSVSERLPGPEDCDAEGRCWVWWKNGVRWVLDEWTHHELREGPLSDYVSHWLPAHAIPLPTAND